MTESKEIKWRKIGGGSLRFIRGKIIKPNEIFLACPEEIPVAFRKQIIPLEDISETPIPVRKKVFVAQEKVVPVVAPEEKAYTLQKRAFGWWDVINVVSGKAINEKGLREDMAQKLTEELNA